MEAAEHSLLDRELYLPKSWTQDPARCREADVPPSVGFATKPELVARMLWRSLEASVPAAWVTGDTVYGSHRPLQAGLCAGRLVPGARRSGGAAAARGSAGPGSGSRGLVAAECGSRQQRAPTLRLGTSEVE